MLEHVGLSTTKARVFPIKRATGKKATNVYAPAKDETAKARQATVFSSRKKGAPVAPAMRGKRSFSALGEADGDHRDERVHISLSKHAKTMNGGAEDHSGEYKI
jgi:hypothetical protein